jgi:hypothetical protein
MVGVLFGMCTLSKVHRLTALRSIRRCEGRLRKFSGDLGKFGVITPTNMEVIGPSCQLCADGTRPSTFRFYIVHFICYKGDRSVCQWRTTLPQQNFG